MCVCVCGVSCFCCCLLFFLLSVVAWRVVWVLLHVVAVVFVLGCCLLSCCWSLLPPPRPVFLRQTPVVGLALFEGTLRIGPYLVCCPFRYELIRVCSHIKARVQPHPLDKGSGLWLRVLGLGFVV